MSSNSVHLDDVNISESSHKGASTQVISPSRKCDMYQKDGAASTENRFGTLVAQDYELTNSESGTRGCGKYRRI